MTGITRGKDFFDYEGVAGATVKRCEAGDPSAHPQGTNDKLFFGEGWATSLWNRMIFDKAIEELLAQRAKDPGQYDVPDVSKDYLVALFINCLRLGRAEWSRNQPADGETFVQARERAQEYGEERADRSMGTSRKKHVSRCANVPLASAANKLAEIRGSRQDIRTDDGGVFGEAGPHQCRHLEMVQG